MSRTISNSDDVIDSRDVIRRIEELESERQSLVDDLDIAQTEDAPDATAISEAEQALAEWANGDDAEELKVLKALADEGESSPDWHYGETLIRDSYFEDYAQELAEDIGVVNREASWPNNHIDWEAAANALKQDYTEVDFDGVSYWIRS